jgi:hypothetical protein
MTPNIHSIIRDHVALSITCIDRLYLNGYVPMLQMPGGLWGFLRKGDEEMGRRHTRDFVGTRDPDG